MIQLLHVYLKLRHLTANRDGTGVHYVLYPKTPIKPIFPVVHMVITNTTACMHCRILHIWQSGITLRRSCMFASAVVRGSGEVAGNAARAATDGEAAVEATERRAIC